MSRWETFPCSVKRGRSGIGLCKSQQIRLKKEGTDTFIQFNGKFTLHCPKYLKRRKIRLIEVNAKCRHLQKLKGLCVRCLSEFIGWRKPISCEHSAMLVFSTQLCDLYSPCCPPLPFPLVQLSPLPLPCVNKCTVLTIYAPVIYTRPCIMFWRRGYTLRGEVGGGWALEFPSFLGPVKWHRADRRVPFHMHTREV